VEFAAFVALAGSLLGQLDEVSHSFGNGASEETDLDAPSGAATNLDIKPNLHRKYFNYSLNLKKFPS